ncbi:helix-turn-helix transcriptional regulator [Crassaminicella thermophila]|uniref:Helix-turn-helix transcriptional regulator n=1 Tax=Crassaminicella thermophila TaxID=2599308 RepID=A0A5C0SHC6_CRATE|nr:helix-turn-helix transcriptional regulator [Crassaminicella thermophila]QEK12628.1 helix-turn-helix transcriptional regulator [Crassaminicella thermophila]
MYSNNLKILRAKHNLSQMELAKKVGVSRNTINSIENSKSIPSLDIALKISSIFNKSVNDIFFTNCGNQDLQKDGIA